MKFPEWLPDRDEFENPGLVECLNVIGDTYYRPIYSLEPQGTGMTAYARGATSLKDQDSVSYTFGGDATKLYKYTAGNWVAINTGYATTVENVWNFAEFGTICVATNKDDVIQKLNAGTDTVFSALAGSPPKASRLAVVGDFLVCANVDSLSNKVQWSGINNIEQWTAGVEESGSQILPEGGAIRAVTSGEFGLIFQDRYITRMNYQGPPLNFSFDVIENNRGTIDGGSVVQNGIYTYFISHNGFYVTDGTQSQPISTEKVDSYFFSKLSLTFSYKITSVVDPVNKTITWSYVGLDSTDDKPNWLIIYNYETQRWSEASVQNEIIFNGFSNASTLEELDALYPDLDAMTISLDSRIFKGGAQSTYAVDINHKLATFTGPALPARIKTGEFPLSPGQKSVLTQVWPQIDGNITVTISSRANYQSTATPSGAIAVNSLGFAPFTNNGRYHSFQFDFDNWTKASGFEFNSEASGVY